MSIKSNKSKRKLYDLIDKALRDIDQDAYKKATSGKLDTP